MIPSRPVVGLWPCTRSKFTERRSLPSSTSKRLNDRSSFHPAASPDRPIPASNSVDLAIPTLTPLMPMKVSAPLASRRKLLGLSVSRSEEHTSELQSLMRISYAVFCLKNKNLQYQLISETHHTR